MKTRKLMILALSVILLPACGNRPKFNLNDYVDNGLKYLEYTVSNNHVRVPYKHSGGVKYIQCLINGTILTDMILDSGCSSNLISIEEAKYLFAKGLLTERDYLGKTDSQIANGTIVKDMVFNIKSIVIADQIECSNVVVVVSSNSNAPLLLGNEILDRMPSYTVDNENQEIVFTLQ